jgi:tetratricopeptide (TPR) repeat protein
LRDRTSDREKFFITAGYETLVTGNLEDAKQTCEAWAQTYPRDAVPRTQLRAGLWETGAAVREAFFGNASEARKRATAARALSKDREVEYGAAFALALSRDSLGSKELADDLERRFPEDTAVRFSYLPTLRARLALNHGDTSKAIELLQVAAPHELGAPRSSIHGLFGALYPVYVRGEAYLAAHQGAEAATEFQKILDHRGIMVSDPIRALAHLQIGRAYAMQGDSAEAKAVYQDFLTLWRDADPDIPILQQAKAEYAKLQYSSAQAWKSNSRLTICRTKKGNFATDYGRLSGLLPSQTGDRNLSRPRYPDVGKGAS